MMRTKSFSIGGLSTRTGVHIETIRYYEKIDLLPKPERTARGHRTYGVFTTNRLQFIRRCRDLGFTLQDIRSLMGMNDHPVTCAEVNKLTTLHLQKIRVKIASLQKMEQTLITAANNCEQGDDVACPIIDALST